MEYGGYFEKNKCHLISESYYFNKKINLIHSGRAALNYFLINNNVKRIYFPDVFCSVLLEPLTLNNVEVHYYSINNNLELKDDIVLQSDEYLFYINYFGIKTTYAQKLNSKYGINLIVDQTHNIFEIANESSSFQFSSIRKFIGVPDGAIFNCKKNIEFITSNNELLTAHLALRLTKGAKFGYQIFQENENKINSDLVCCNPYSEKEFYLTDWKKIQSKRKENFNTLHNILKATNNFFLCNDIDLNIETPFTYPYLPNFNLEISSLWEKSIFAPILWPQDKFKKQTDYDFTKILHLPIDHRYSENDIVNLSEIVLNFGYKK